MTNPNYLTEFMGTLLTKEVDTCLRLQSLLLGVSRAELVRELITDYIKEYEFTSEKLIERYATYIYSEWELRYKEKYRFKDYLSTHYIPAIRKQNHPEALILQIVKKCEEVAQKASANK